MATMVKGGADKGTLCFATAARTMKNVGKLPDTEILHSGPSGARRTYQRQYLCLEDNVRAQSSMDPIGILGRTLEMLAIMSYLLPALDLFSKIYQLFLTAEMYTLTREQ
jgi:hypothetical protein